MALVIGVLIVGSLSVGSGRAERPVTIFAAASTAGAIEAAARDFESKGGAPVRVVLAASSTLARQIAQGAPADLYLSANTAWMDHLARGGGIEPDSRVDLLGNRLVLIAPIGRSFDIEIAPGFALAAALGNGRLAMGDPDHVPAGIYAKDALTRLGVWAAVAPKAAFAADARAALVLVERGEAAAGIVYASDAAENPGVRVVARFAAASHGPIIYPLAIVREHATAAVIAFHRYLQGDAARSIYQAWGFSEVVGVS